MGWGGRGRGACLFFLGFADEHGILCDRSHGACIVLCGVERIGGFEGGTLVDGVLRNELLRPAGEHHAVDIRCRILSAQ